MADLKEQIAEFVKAADEVSAAYWERQKFTFAKPTQHRADFISDKWVRVVANHWRLHMEVFEFRVFGITTKIETPNMRVVFWILKSLAASGEAIQVLREGHWIDLEIAKVETKKKRAA